MGVTDLKPISPAIKIQSSPCFVINDTKSNGYTFLFR